MTGQARFAGLVVRVLLVVAVAATSACRGDGPADRSSTADAGEADVTTAGSGTAAPRALPISGDDEFWPRRHESMAGWLDSDGNGCWTIDVQSDWGDELVVFAAGSTIGSDGLTVTTPGGSAVTARALVEVVGRAVPPRRWPDGGTGRWADHSRACGRMVASMFVIEEVETHRFDATRLGLDEVEAMIVSASFSSGLSCAYRLARSDPAREVGVVVELADPAAAIRGELPDDRLEVTVLIGEPVRHRYHEGCPGWIVAQRLPLVGGAFEFTPPVQGAVGTATFTIDDAVVSLPDRNVDLGRIRIENDCYWCGIE